MSNKILRGQQIHSEKIGVNQENPIYSIHVSGDIFSDKYEFGGNTILHSPSQVIDFDSTTFQDLTLTGDLNLSTTNRTSDSNKIKSVTVKINAGNSDRNLTFNSSIRFIGNAPIKIKANKIGLLSLNSFGLDEVDTVAAYMAEGEGLVNIPNNTVLLNQGNNIVGDTRFYFESNSDIEPFELNLSGHFYVTDSGTFTLGSESGAFGSAYSDNYYSRGKNLSTLPYNNDMWTGDGSNTNWIMSQGVGNAREIMVMVDGSVKVPYNEYTINNETGIIFGTAPTNDKVIDIRYF